MAIQGIITDIGLQNFQLADNNEGFYIHPTSFAVSDIYSTLDPARTTPNGGVWYTGPISSRVVVDINTVKFICTVPPGAIPPNTTKFAKEVYLFGQDNLFNNFLMAIGHTSVEIIYEPTGSVTLELEISLVNIPITDYIVFSFTQATEVSEHNQDCNAHPELIQNMNKAGLFIPCGGQPFSYAGQSFDEKPVVEGTKAQFVYGGVVFSAIHNGTELNGATITFDNVKTTDEIMTEFNAANPHNPIEHDDNTGLLVLAAGIGTFASGSYLVDDKDVVYRDTDGVYKQALADGTIKSRIAGILDRPNRIVRSQGFIDVTTGFAIGDELYLSSVNPGKIVNTQTFVKLGVQIRTATILIGTSGGGQGQTIYDAIVTDAPGYNHFPTTAQAIAAVGNNSSILVDKMDYLLASLNPTGKRIDFHFNGANTGWSKYLGNAEAQRITFSAVPTSGTWRIGWNSQETVDLAYNASTTDIQNAINALTGPGLPVTVTGSYATYFDVVWTSFVDVPQMTFVNPGQNEIQQITFGNVPDNGGFTLDFNAQITPQHTWNDDAMQLEVYLETLSNIDDVQVTGSYATQEFTVEWVGVDGLAPKNQLVLDTNSLQQGVNPTSVNIATLQQGIYPSQNVYNGVTPVAITVQTIDNGIPVGPTTAITVGGDYTRFIGHGLIQNFDNGIDLNGYTGVEIEMVFDGVINPTIETGLIPEIDYHKHNSFGLTRQRVRTVGLAGDYDSLWDAITAANNGDKIIVADDQSLTTNQIINKEIEIEFIHGAKINVPSFLSGNLITLGTKTRTKHMRLSVSVAGTYDTLFLLDGTRGYHEDLTVECSNPSVTVNYAFRVNSGATAIFCHGILSRGSAVVISGLTNDSIYNSHDIVIRDIEGGDLLFIGLAGNPVQEIPAGVVDGVNAIFTLSEPPVNSNSLLVMLDGVIQRETTAWTLSGVTLTFVTPPAFGQQVDVFFVPAGLVNTPPRHLEVLDNLALQLFQTRKINFGTGLTVVVDSSEQVTINGAVGAFSNVGTGAGQVYRDTTLGTANLKTIKSAAGNQVINNADDIAIKSAIYDAVVGTAADVTSGRATHSDLQTACVAAGSGGSVYILPGATTGALSLTFTPALIAGAGELSIITGAVSISPAADGITFKNVKFGSTLTIDSGSTRHCFESVVFGGTVNVNGNHNRFINYLQESGVVVNDNDTNNFFLGLSIP